MKNLAFSALVIIAALGGSIEISMVRSAHSSELFISKIERCALEDFMLQHRMLYHVSLNRSDATSLSLLCTKQSDVQKTLTLKSSKSVPHS